MYGANATSWDPWNKLHGGIFWVWELLSLLFALPGLSYPRASQPPILASYMLCRPGSVAGRNAITLSGRKLRNLFDWYNEWT